MEMDSQGMDESEIVKETKTRGQEENGGITGVLQDVRNLEIKNWRCWPQ